MNTYCAKLQKQDDELREGLAALYIRARRRYGYALPNTWIDRPSAFYSWALDLISAMRGNATEIEVMQ